MAARRAGRPDEVIDATREYESEQDTFSMFLEEKCVCVANARVLSNDALPGIQNGQRNMGRRPASHKTFASLMSERGFAKSKTMKGALVFRASVCAPKTTTIRRSRPQPTPRQSAL